MFFDIEDAIVKRLDTKLAVINPRPRISDSTGLDDMQNRSQSAAGVFVAYNGLTEITPQPGDPSRVTVQQMFIVWTVTRSASRASGQAGTREAADPIMVAILEALCGWRPATETSRIELVDTPAPAYGDDGFGYFPLAFALKQQIRGNPT